MKPAELYKRTPERIDNDINRLYGCYFNHIPEIEALQYGGGMLEDKDKRIAIHYYKDFDYDCRRIWALAAVKFDDQFVMIIQNAGREGDDWHKRFITDSHVYIDMVRYIATLVPAGEDRSQDDFVDLNEDINGLTHFYGGDLDGYFERY